MRTATPYILATLVLSLTWLGVWGQGQKRRADRAEATLAECRGSLEHREQLIDGLESNRLALRERIDQQNRAVDELADRAAQEAARVERAEVETRLLRRAASERVVTILAEPPPETCEGAVTLLSAEAPGLVSAWR